MEYFKTAVDIMAWIVFGTAAVTAAFVLAACLLGEKPVRRARDAKPQKKFKCPSMKLTVSEEACKFHRAMTPEACVNCLIPLAEVKG